MKTSAAANFELETATPSISHNRFFFTIVATVVALFAVLSLLNIDVPGLYMDGINPDYEVVKILHPSAPVLIWEAPGDLIFGRFPAMFGLYSGSFAAYWAIPFYLLLGGSILSVRLAHAGIGILILISSAMLLRRLTHSLAVTGATLLMVALDPLFLFVFRTQAYIIIFGVPFLITALYVLNRFPTVRGAFAAGVLAGLASSDYFVYFFCCVGIVFYFLLDTSLTQKRKTILSFALGVAVGVLPFITGYGLLFWTLGLGGGLAWLHTALVGLHVSSGDGGYFGQVSAVVLNLKYLLTSEWQWATIWQMPHDDAGQDLKAIVLFAVTSCGLAAFARFKAGYRSLMLVVLPMLTFVACATYFGSRVGAHDLVPVLVLLYLSAAITVSLTLQNSARLRIPVRALSFVVAVGILGTNVSATQAEISMLASNGGVGLYAPVISQFPKRVLAEKDRSPYIFLSWGEMMPFIYETGGEVPVVDVSQLADSICRYGHANVVLLGADASATDPLARIPLTRIKLQSSQNNGDKLGLKLKVLSLSDSRLQSGCVADTAHEAQIGAADVAPKAAMADGLIIEASSLSHGVSFSAEPNTVAPEETGQLPAVNVEWSAPSSEKLEVHMGAPDGKLFTQGGSTGSAATGNWIQAGVQFYLQDVSKASPGRTMGKLTVRPCHGCVKRI